MVMRINVLQFLFIFLLMIFNESLIAQNVEDCQKIKKGKFIFETANEEIFLIKRSHKKQIEISLKNNIKIITKINWISPCEYELSFLESNSDDENISKFYKIPIRVKILSVEKNKYTFTSSGFDELIQIGGEMKKINRRTYKKYLRNHSK